MKISNIILPVALCGALLAFAPKASAIPTTLSVGDSHYLGYSYDGTPANVDNVATYLNNLLTVALGSSSSIGGQTLVRSSNFGGLSGATVSSASGQYTDFGNDVTDIDISGLGFISVHYGNNGQQFWYVGDLTGTINLPDNAIVPQGGTGGGNSGVLGFIDNSRTNNVSTPDGGSTVLLLGAALSGLGMMTRRFKK